MSNYISKNLSNKNSQKLLGHAEKFAIDALQSSSKRAIQKTAEATGDLIGNKISDKITNVSKKSSQNALKTDENEIEIPKDNKWYINSIIYKYNRIPKNNKIVRQYIKSTIQI